MRRPAPFSTISSNGDDPGRCGHLREAFSTPRYPKMHGCCSNKHLLYLLRSRYLCSIFCTKIAGETSSHCGRFDGKIWIQEGLSPPENVVPQPGIVPSRRNDQNISYAPQGSKLGCFLHRARATIRSECVPYMPILMSS